MTRTRFSVNLVVSFLAVAAGLLAAQRSSAATLICFGDSLTRGISGDPRDVYLDRLSAYLNATIGPSELRNRGVQGEITPDGLPRLRSILRNETAGYVLIMEGTNDTYRWATDPATVDARRTEQNLTAMVREVQNHPPAIAIIATTPPRVADTADPANNDTKNLNSIIRRVAASTGAVLAEVYNNVEGHASTATYIDHLHVNRYGAALMAEAFAAAITGNAVSTIDLTPPIPIRLTPAANSIANSVTSAVEITVREIKSVLDPTLAVMTIDGAVVSPTVENSGGQTLFRYRFPSTLRFGQRVSVSFRVSDTSTVPGPNEYAVSFAFTTLVGNGTNGDIDRLGRIDGADLAVLAGSFGAGRRDTRFRTTADIDGNQVVDGLDLMVISGKFGGPP